MVYYRIIELEKESSSPGRITLNTEPKTTTQQQETRPGTTPSKVIPFCSNYYMVVLGLSGESIIIPCSATTEIKHSNDTAQTETIPDTVRLVNLKKITLPIFL